MKSPSFPFYPSDFTGATTCMTAEEVGVYMRFLCHQWNSGSIPNDDKRLTMIAGFCSPESIQTAKCKFQIGEDGCLRNERMESIRNEKSKFLESASKSGKKGGGNPNFKPGRSNPYYSKTEEKIKVPLSDLNLEDKGGHKAKINSPSPSPSPSPFPIPNPSPSTTAVPWHEPSYPSQKEVVERAKFIGLGEWKAVDWFQEMEGCGWMDHNQRPILKWQPIMDRVKTKWEADGRPSQPPSAKPQVKKHTSPNI